MKIQLFINIFISFASIGFAIKNKTYSSGSEAGGYGSGSTLLGDSSSYVPIMSLSPLQSIQKMPPLPVIMSLSNANKKSVMVATVPVVNTTKQSPRPSSIVLHQTQTSAKATQTPAMATAYPHLVIAKPNLRHRPFAATPIPGRVEPKIISPSHHHNDVPVPPPFTFPSQYDNQCVYIFETLTGELVMRR